MQLLYPIVTSLILATTQARYVMYLTGQHPEPPTDVSLVSEVSHVVLAFMSSSRFNELPTAVSTAEPHSSEEMKWPFFTTVTKTRKQFKKGTKILIAIGGWGDEEGFEMAARTKERQELWARNVARMVTETGADGIDIDWEYPGGNGEHYLKPNHTNPTKAWQITAYPELLSTLRKHLASSKLITAAVPGRPHDMLAFTPATIPSILPSISFFNIMTYDLMNRRDTITLHHAGIQASLTSINAYISAGVPPSTMNLGFAFYVKYFKTDSSLASREICRLAWKTNSGIGCPTGLMEDPNTGGDLGKTGGFSWHDRVPSEVEGSFDKAKTLSKWDPVGGGNGYWDEQENLWWTWENEKAIMEKVEKVVKAKGIEGVFAWGLGEDGDKFEHLQALNKAYNNLQAGRQARNEL